MRWLALVALLTSCGKHVGIGEVCTKAEECGNGADCYHGVCTPMCADDSECQGELVCARHRCLTAMGEPKTTDAPSEPKHADAAAETPSNEPTKIRPGFRPNTPEGPHTGDVTGELRAIRTELEQIRAEQQRLREAVEKLQNK